MAGRDVPLKECARDVTERPTGSGWHGAMRRDTHVVLLGAHATCGRMRQDDRQRVSVGPCDFGSEGLACVEARQQGVGVHCETISSGHVCSVDMTTYVC